jgi:hypothetical protein
MGFVVQDETFDMWRKRKTPYDYSIIFRNGMNGTSLTTSFVTGTMLQYLCGVSEMKYLNNGNM